MQLQLPTQIPVLESARLIYRPLTTAHLSDEYLGWLNDPEVCFYLESPRPYTSQMLKEYLEDVEKKTPLFWAIHLKDDGCHIGNIKIDPINERHGLGEYGILIGKRSEWGKGYAAEASRRIIEYCFEEINLRKMTLGVVKDNAAAVKLYYKLQFTLEGVYRDHGFYGDKCCDMLRMALFNPAFAKYD